MRLIDADRLKEVFRRNTGYDYADIIDMQPTVNVLDKIRAEISDLDTYYDNDYFVGNKDAMFKCQEVLQIIDKYRKEQE